MGTDSKPSTGKLQMTPLYEACLCACYRKDDRNAEVFRQLLSRFVNATAVPNKHALHVNGFLLARGTTM